MNIDLTAVARTPDPERVRDWLAGQRIFISSAMDDTGDERRHVAAAIEAEGARPVWFEELGRDADAQEAYLSGVDTSTIYVGILNELYGRMDETGFSATETEYNRAREHGQRIGIFVRSDAPRREGHLRQFIDRIRVFVTTENYSDLEDLARRVRRRLHELAAEALSPWVKLDDLVFRADQIVDRGNEITVSAQTSDDIVYRLEALRDQMHGSRRVRFVYGDRVVDANLEGVERTVRFGGAADVVIRLAGATRIQEGGFGRASIGGMTPDDLVESGLRELFFGEAPPRDAHSMGMTQTGIDEDALAEAFGLPNEVVSAVTRLVVADGLIGSSNAARLTELRIGPAVSGGRNVLLIWEPPAQYGSSVATRRLEGVWRTS